MAACVDTLFPEIGEDGLPLTPLAREFYTSPEWFERDIEAIFRKRWLFVCHISEIPNPGDYTTYQLVQDSIIVARDKSGQINAFHNVCRHKGNLLCEHGKGNAKSFACPFHAWTYELDGSLRSAPLIDDIDKAAFSAKKVWCEVWNGIVFINLSKEHPKSVAEHMVNADFAGHQLERAKIIEAKDYHIEGNWKVNGETYQECYHCAGIHRDTLAKIMYSATTYAAFNHAPPTDVAEDAEFLIFSEDQREGCYKPGVETESLDGQFVTRRLLGETQQTPKLVSWFPNFALGACPDYAFIIDWIPVSATGTHWRTRWFVHEDAVEGVDYDRDEVVLTAHLVNVEDKAAVERLQSGINSSAYEPGPYQKPTENDSARYVRQYIEIMKRALAERGN
jgi:phenylpropionate dioxygenase-like ring-hydroxylating dioxygenase large terminal subunit